ncbi:hypothetical protein CE143_01380 [Photorhabdus luminescens]|uniref:Uncharacterized protein n=1 Tax=Photorhabdus akhurstii TaxID=171438 RepID=A0ABX8LNV8_9GAMM|nr:hypothetical protein C6H69_16930 [Photorhabdus luminescens]QXF31976.1 hypothetical protein B0X70_01380 [Photorhabdus akhurstii]UJD73770.1 hypothetical protein CE143_01380 [Photorhabdus luminescens]
MIFSLGQHLSRAENNETFLYLFTILLIPVFTIMKKLLSFYEAVFYVDEGDEIEITKDVCSQLSINIDLIMAMITNLLINH